MLARLSHTRLLRYAGLFTWAMVGLPLLYSWLGPWLNRAPDDSVALQPMPWQGWVAYLAFGIGYAWLTRGLGRRRTAPDFLLLIVVTLAALGVSYFNGSGLGSVLLMVAACVLPWLLPLPLGIAWLVASQLAVAPVFIRWLGFPAVEALMQSMLYAGFSGFVFITSLVALQQTEAREDQRRLNAELRATRVLLAESARVNERTRISRELHDLLGHHLTALSLNLEVAGHLAEGKALEHVRQSHTLAKLLLTDVREVVSEMREDGGIDLTHALKVLVEGVPALQVDLELPERLHIEDPERAQVLLRCAQEIITNTVRHSGASHLSLTMTQDAGEIRLAARDNGRGCERAKPGNGLRGMRERLSAYGGQVDIITAPGQGFALDVRIPLETAT